MLELRTRFGNIGIEEDTAPRPGRSTLIIVRHHENPYYGMLEEYLSSGWVDVGTHLSLKGATLPKSAFEEAESGYAVAHIHLEEGAPTTRLESVDDRLYALPEGEYADFFEACRHADITLLRRSECAPHFAK